MRGPYALQAAIVACHAEAMTANDTDWPRIDQHLRITIGTRDECAALVSALQAILG